MPEAQPDRLPCDLCGRPTARQASYVVQVSVFADPALPPVTAEQVAAMDLDKTMEELLAEMEHLSADDLLDQVHRKFEYRICPVCQPKFLANPLGKPRFQNEGAN